MVASVGMRCGDREADAVPDEEIGARTTRSVAHGRTTTRLRLDEHSPSSLCRARRANATMASSSSRRGVVALVDTRRVDQEGDAVPDDEIGARTTRSAAHDRTTTRSRLDARSPPSCELE